jgi:hypothetical protein
MNKIVRKELGVIKSCQGFLILLVTDYYQIFLKKKNEMSYLLLLSSIGCIISFLVFARALLFLVTSSFVML